MYETWLFGAQVTWAITGLLMAMLLFCCIYTGCRAYITDRMWGECWPEGFALPDSFYGRHYSRSAGEFVRVVEVYSVVFFGLFTGGVGGIVCGLVWPLALIVLSGWAVLYAIRAAVRASKETERLRKALAAHVHDESGKAKYPN